MKKCFTLLCMMICTLAIHAENVTLSGGYNYSIEGLTGSISVKFTGAYGEMGLCKALPISIDDYKGFRVEFDEAPPVGVQVKVQNATDVADTSYPGQYTPADGTSTEIAANFDTEHFANDRTITVINLQSSDANVTVKIKKVVLIKQDNTEVQTYYDTSAGYNKQVYIYSADVNFKEQYAMLGNWSNSSATANDTYQVTFGTAIGADVLQWKYTDGANTDHYKNIAPGTSASITIEGAYSGLGLQLKASSATTINIASIKLNEGGEGGEGGQGGQGGEGGQGGDSGSGNNGTVSGGWLLAEDFEGFATGTAITVYPIQYQAKGTATVDASPTDAEGKAAHFVAADYNNSMEFSITLPEGKTLKDYSNIGFDFYRTANDKNYVNMHVIADAVTIHADSNYPNQGATETWIEKTFPIDENISVGQSFKLRIGLNSDKGDFFIDNIRFKERVPAGTSYNGQVVNGWLIVEDFEAATSVDLWDKNGITPTGTGSIVANPTASTEKVASFVGGNYDTVLNISVTLPEGKTLKNYTDISFMLYRNSGDGNYKKMLVQADDFKIHEDDDYIEQAAATTWTEKSYPIDQNNTIGNTFNLRLGIQSDAADYLIDYVRLKENPIATGISMIDNESEMKNDVIYTISGVRTQKVTKGIYIVNGKKVVIK